MEDRRGRMIGTIREWKPGDEDLRAEDDSRTVGHFDRDTDAGEIHDCGGPDK
jgi:hypothetical protein